ncbi:hypothetical protein V8G54_026347, partial [Vigna mungo]
MYVYEGSKDLIIESKVELQGLCLALHSVQPPTKEEESEKSSSSSHRERPDRERQRQRVHPTPQHFKRNLPPHQSLLLPLLFHFLYFSILSLLFFRLQTLHHRRLGLGHRHRGGRVGIGICSPWSGGIGENLIGDIGIIEVAIDIGIGSGIGIGIGIGLMIFREEGEVVVADGVE